MVPLELFIRKVLVSISQACMPIWVFKFPCARTKMECIPMPSSEAEIICNACVSLILLCVEIMINERERNINLLSECL